MPNVPVTAVTAVFTKAVVATFTELSPEAGVVAIALAAPVSIVPAPTS